MALQAAVLNDHDKIRLRDADANRELASSGVLGVENGRDAIVYYLELLEEFHNSYDLDPEELYEFDAARGIVFQAMD